ncbi:hypothetical protein KZX70_02740 [Paenibacillus silvae]|nr:hypothetical protein [Paenibacillus silvae]MCK6073756.1 hypothetical protein [Paenibacillus silvae]MCK6267068.1 hypothetical protein [Paenibacillus silvae]
MLIFKRGDVNVDWLKRLIKVVGSMLSDLWLGSYRRNSDHKYTYKQ